MSEVNKELEERFRAMLIKKNQTQCDECEAPLKLEGVGFVYAGETEAGTEYGLVFLDCVACDHRIFEAETWATPELGRKQEAVEELEYAWT